MAGAASDYRWLRELLRVYPASWDTRLALRAALAAGVPIVIGIAFDVVDVAFWAALAGLLSASNATLGDYRAQLGGLAVSTAIAVTGFLAGWTAGLSPPLYLATLAAASCLAGLLSAFGHAASVGAMQALLVASIAVGIPSLAPFWKPALGFLAGVGLYGVLLAGEAAFDGRLPRRRTLAAVLAALASLADRLAALRVSADPTAIAAEMAARRVAHARLWALHATVFDGQYGGPAPGAPFRVVLEAADEVYDLIVAPASDGVRLGAAAERLSAAAAAVERPAPATAAAASMAAADDPMAQRVAALVAAARRAVADGSAPAQEASRRRPLLETARGIVGNQRSRDHALRLGLCMGIAFATKFAALGPHWYWVPLTVAIALKPDFGSVAVRALQRCTGTVGGVILGGLALAVLPQDLAMAAAVAALAATLPWARQLSYATLVFFMTPIILILLELIQPVASVSIYGDPRILDTFIGAGIVLIFGYYLWPSARRRDFAGAFGEAMDEVAAYLQTATREDQGTVFEARHRAYGTLGQLHNVLRQSLAEPPPAGRQAYTWLRIVAAAQRLCDSVGALGSSGDAASIEPERIDALAARIRAAGADPGAEAPQAGEPQGGSEPVSLRAVESDLAQLSALAARTLESGRGGPHDRAGDQGRATGALGFGWRMYRRRRTE